MQRIYNVKWSEQVQGFSITQYCQHNKLCLLYYPPYINRLIVCKYTLSTKNAKNLQVSIIFPLHAPIFFWLFNKKKRGKNHIQNTTLPLWTERSVIFFFTKESYNKLKSLKNHYLLIWKYSQDETSSISLIVLQPRNQLGAIFSNNFENLLCNARKR